MEYSFKPSRTLATGNINLDIKSSRGGEKTLALPESAQGIRLHDYKSRQWEPVENFRVRLALKSGTNQFSFEWQHGILHLKRNYLKL